MAEQLQESPDPEKAHSKWPHDWHSYEDYLNVYTRYMDNLLNEGVVLYNGLSFRNITYRNEIIQIEIKGRIECASGVNLIVEKWLNARRSKRGHLEVRGSSYSYHAYIRRPERYLLRYDCHGSQGLLKLHKHTYDPKTGNPIDNVPITLDQLPPLDEVIREAVTLAS